jgi:hypothetical protein
VARKHDLVHQRAGDLGRRRQFSEQLSVEQLDDDRRDAVRQRDGCSEPGGDVAEHERAQPREPGIGRQGSGPRHPDDESGHFAAVRPDGARSRHPECDEHLVLWSAATDDIGVAGYGVYRNGGLVDSTQQTTYTMSSLTCGTNYSVGVDAFDAASNRSAQTTVLVTTAACPDIIAPTAPSGLTVTSASASGISLRWTQSSDNVSVTGYNVFLNGTKTGTPRARATASAD